MKKNQQNILAMSFLYSFGSAIVGVFFPFLVSNAFGFEIWQLMLWMASHNFIGTFIVYPVNKYLNKNFSIRQNLQIGLSFLALFYLIISISRDSVWLIGLATVFYILGLYIFWPSYHLFNLQSTKNGKRGNFVGSIQAVFVSANVLAPLISGFLLDKNLDAWVSLVATVSFGSAIYFSRKLEFPKCKLENFAGIWKFFKTKFYRKSIFWMSLIDGLTGGTLMFIWPIFFKSVLVGFTQMGGLVSFTAITEIISAKFFGRVIDKKSAQKTLRYSAIVRFFDLGIRGLLFWFPTALMAGIASFFAGFLGPVFNISFYTRIIEIAEENPKQEFEFFIAREWILSIARIFTYSFASFLAFTFGVKSFAILLFIAALASFSLRRS